MTVVRQLAAWAATASPAWSALAIERAEHAVEDVVACMVAGAGDVGAARVRDAVASWGSGPCTVVGQRATAAAPWASLANGMSAHVLDYDDNFGPGLTHATAVLVPALLALGEEVQASGRQVLDAYLVGLEMQAAISRGVNRAHYDAGWHATGTVGCIGTAAGCGRLLGLDAERLAHALSLSVSMAAGIKVQFGTMAKPLHAGLAAQHAVTAARLAAAGVEGHEEALEGRLGFRDLFGGPEARGWEAVLPRLGKPLAIEEHGLIPKRFPCCGSAHQILDGVLSLRREHGFTAGDVVAVEALIGSGNKRNLMYEDPQQEMEARFSLQYCVAVALLHGRLTLADFTLEAVHRPEVRRLLGLTTVKTYDPAEEPQDPDLRLPHVVTITLKDGRRLSVSCLHARGTIQNPFDEADRAAKFRDCCEGVLPPESFDAVRHALAAFRALDSVAALTHPLRFQAAADRGERFRRHPAWGLTGIRGGGETRGRA